MLKSRPSVGGDELDPHAWVLIDEAAELLDCTTGHLGRKCRDVLGNFGQAKKFSPPDGGKPRWYLSRSYDARLGVGRLGDAYQLPDLSAYTERQRNTAFARAACVKAYREARGAWKGPQKTWLPHLVKQLAKQHPTLKISSASLRRWHRDFQRPADLSKLIDRRGRNKGGDADAQVWEYFQSIFLDERKPSIHVCWLRADEFAQAESLEWCSYDTCRRQLDDRIPPQIQAQFRDPEAYRFNFRPYLPQDPEAYKPGERWDGDHAVLDMWCVFDDKPIRPWITAWMDWRSRRVVGWVLSDAPNSSTILAAFGVGLRDEANMGGPDLVWIDNGKDYDSYMFHGMTKAERQKLKRERMHNKEMGRLARIDGGVRVDETKTAGIYNMLDIEAHFSIPHNPTGKARIERWFGTMHDQFDRTFISYTGRSPDNRPEGLAAVMKQPHKLPTFEHVRDRLAEYVAGYNATVSFNRKGAVGLSPDQAMALCERKRYYQPGVLDQCLQHWHKPVSVGRNGITISPWGKPLSYGRFDQSIARYKRPGRGKSKPKLHIAFDPEDVRRIRVFDSDWRFVSTLSADGFGNCQTEVGRKDVGELIASQRRYKASRRDVAKNSHHEYLSTGEQLARQRRKKDREQQQAEAHRLRLAEDVPVETPLDGTAAPRPKIKRPLTISNDRRMYGAKGMKERGIVDSDNASSDLGDFAEGIETPTQAASHASSQADLLADFFTEDDSFKIEDVEPTEEEKALDAYFNGEEFGDNYQAKGGVA